MMVVNPKVRGFICTTAHPTGCREHVRQQIAYIRNNPPISGPKNVLVIGASTGYGLASWISALFGAKANAVGVFYERPASGNRTATAGWYNAAAVEEFAQENDLFAASINGDAFSNEIKLDTCNLLKRTIGKIDLIVYSLASPRRVLPGSGKIVSSVLKTIDRPFKNKSVDPIKGELTEVEIGHANIDEINSTVQVMGGEDWQLWIEILQEQGLLANGVTTLAYSYIGPELTFPIYRNGTIGKAKEHLEETVGQLNRILKQNHGQAYVSINKGLVTQASAAIPVVPLYISLLFKVMKDKNIHEGCIEQIYRLYQDFLYAGKPIITDAKGRIRIDDLEMRDDVQQKVAQLWESITQENLWQNSDLAGYQHDFYKLFGFGFANIDYEKPVNTDVKIPSLVLGA